MKREWELAPLAHALVEEQKPTYPRIKDMVQGLCAKLAASPEMGTPVPGKPGRMYKVFDPAIPGLPRVVAVYSFSERKLLVHGLRITTPLVG